MVKVYVEGGGDHNPSLAQDVRQGFRDFFVKAGIDKRPRVVVCGSRKSAYDNYRIAVDNDQTAMLLVDSEAPVQDRYEQGDIRFWKPWEHLQSRRNHSGEQFDSWEKVGADTDCHLMVQMMETWFLADVATMKEYFDGGFRAEKFPKDNEDIERISKEKINEILYSSAKDTKKKGYIKGRDSFSILSLIDPKKVCARSKWAERFCRLLTEKMDEGK